MTPQHPKNDTPEEIDEIEWLSTRLVRGKNEIGPSCAAIKRFVAQLIDYPFPARLGDLAVTTMLGVITSHHQNTLSRQVTGQAGASHTGSTLEVECPSENRGTTLYRHVPDGITLADLKRIARIMARTTNRPTWFVVVTRRSIKSKVPNWEHRLYEMSVGVEFRVFDRLTFLEHFLDLYHQHRGEFVEALQAAVLADSDTVMTRSQKHAFLAFRLAHNV